MALPLLTAQWMVIDERAESYLVLDWFKALSREEVLDMHNSHQSFSGRQRIRNQMGTRDNQVIWFTRRTSHRHQRPKPPPAPDKFFESNLASTGRAPRLDLPISGKILTRAFADNSLLAAVDSLL